MMPENGRWDLIQRLKGQVVLWRFTLCVMIAVKLLMGLLPKYRGSYPLLRYLDGEQCSKAFDRQELLIELRRILL